MDISKLSVDWAAPLRRRAAMALAVVCLGDVVALAVHNGSTPAAASASAPAVSTTAPPAPPTTAATVPAKAHAAAAPKAGRKTTATTAATAPAWDVNAVFPVSKEGYSYEVVLTPTCAKPGQTLTAVMKLKPRWNSAGVMMPFYSDGSYEKGAGQIAKPDGTVTYTWVARPITGEGRLVTRSQDPDTQEPGTNIVAFRVVEATGSC